MGLKRVGGAEASHLTERRRANTRPRGKQAGHSKAALMIGLGQGRKQRI